MKLVDQPDLYPSEPCEFYTNSGKAWFRGPLDSPGRLIRRPNSFAFDFINEEESDQPEPIELVLESDGLYHWRQDDGGGHWIFIHAETATHTYLIGNTRSEDNKIGSSIFVWPKEWDSLDGKSGS